MKKIVIISLILTIITYICMGCITQNEVYAVSRENLSSKLDSYPGYTELINNLKAKYPNWNFTILYTGLDWSQVIKNETSAWHGRNLISSSKSGEWICSTCGGKSYDNGSWRCASEAAVSYYMDPRNGLNEDYIFQFEALSYNGNVQNIDGVKKIIADVGFMQGNQITYKKTDGSTGTINKSYAQVIMEAAQEAGISPYHLAARIRQEQGTGSTASATGRGDYSGYVGYYNLLNIRATGSTSAQIIANALTYAKNNGLDTPEKSIKEGAKFLAQSYIGRGQDTLYLQKFDVDSSDGSLYSHQYMQNVSAAMSEGTTVKSSYASMGLMTSPINFIIPVYENMPSEKCSMPGTETVVTQNVVIKGTKVNIRDGKGTGANIIANLNNGDNLLRIELATSTINGYYWDKVVLSDGRQGYVARNYLTQVADIKTCDERVIANTGVNLRNGPGTSGTKIITMLVKGQAVTRIEKGKYNVDGYIWDKVVLSDGRQGYVATNYLNFESSNNNGGTTTNEIIRVICGSGLKVRQSPGTSSNVLTYTKNGDQLTRIQKDCSTANGYTWDKIITSSGVEGYIARGTTSGSEIYVEVVTSGSSESNSTVDTISNYFEIIGDNIICIPETTVVKIKEKNSNSIVKHDGNVLSDSELVRTGTIVNIDGKDYTIIKKGDVNGDGKIDLADSLILSKHVLQVKEISNSLYEQAGDINEDEKIDLADTLNMQKYILDIQKITL